MHDLTLAHEYLHDGAADVELGLQVWAQLIVGRLRREGNSVPVPDSPPPESNGGRPS